MPTFRPLLPTMSSVFHAPQGGLPVGRQSRAYVPVAANEPRLLPCEPRHSAPRHTLNARAPYRPSPPPPARPMQPRRRGGGGRGLGAPPRVRTEGKKDLHLDVRVLGVGADVHVPLPAARPHALRVALVQRDGREGELEQRCLQVRGLHGAEDLWGGEAVRVAGGDTAVVGRSMRRGCWGSGGDVGRAVRRGSLRHTDNMECSRLPPNRRWLPANRRRLSPNRRRLPSNRRRLPPSPFSNPCPYEGGGGGSGSLRRAQAQDMGSGHMGLVGVWFLVWALQYTCTRGTQVLMHQLG